MVLESALHYVPLIILVSVFVGDKILGWLKGKGIDLTKLEDIYELTYDLTEATKSCQEICKKIDRRLNDNTLEKAIGALSENVAVQTELLRVMVAQIKAQAELQNKEHSLILDQVSRMSKQ
jgi:hypothetical protein